MYKLQSIFAASAFAVLVLAVSLKLIPMHFIVLNFHDDSFFYIKTAYNISQGLGPTFDGLNTTNGFHPLYMGVLAVVSLLSPLVGYQGIITVFIFDSFLFLLFILIYDRFLQLVNFRTVTRVVLLVLVSLMLCLNDFGTEARLLLPLTWCYLTISYRSIHDPPKGTHFLGAFMGCLLVLTRIDAIILVSCVAMFIGVTSMARMGAVTRREGIYLIFLHAFPPALCLFLIGLFNRIFYSRFETISSFLKTGWPGTFHTHWLSALSGAQKARMLFLVMISVIYFLWFLRFGGITRRNSAQWTNRTTFTYLLFFLNLGNLLYLLVLVFFSRGAVGSWYLAVPMSIALSTLFFLFEGDWFENIFSMLRIPHKIHQGLFSIASVSMLVFQTGLLVARYHSSDRQDDIRMGRWIQSNLPANARIFQVDNCGFVGYFGERSIINGDGLIKRLGISGIPAKRQTSRLSSQIQCLVYCLG